MTRRERLRNYAIFLGVLLLLAVVFALVFFLTEWLYNLIGLNLPTWLVQVINSLSGLFVFGLLITALSKVFKTTRLAQEMKIYGPIIEALERIAKGDFSVSVSNTLDRQIQERSVIGELINSVNKMAVELNQLETMRQEFISNVSHEIQSPLTSIRGFAQALQTDNIEAPQRQHYLAIIETESIRLSKLSDNLLKLASLEAAQVKFEPERYRLDRQIRNLIVACEPQWVEKTLEMDINLSEVMIEADQDMLNQVWLNLLHNSIKFTPPNGMIRINLNYCQDTITFKICDTGIGISEQEQTHVFERFYKADKSRTSLNGGSGLGLSITRKIIELHRGTIRVESQPNIGATFTVCLPNPR